MGQKPSSELPHVSGMLSIVSMVQWKIVFEHTAMNISNKEFWGKKERKMKGD